MTSVFYFFFIVFNSNQNLLKNHSFILFVIYLFNRKAFNHSYDWQSLMTHLLQYRSVKCNKSKRFVKPQESLTLLTWIMQGKTLFTCK